jgi:DNA-binding Lrp family transcriptional regulator
MKSDHEIKLLSILQNDFPIEPRPFHRVADCLHIPLESVFRSVNSYLKKGVIRYIGAIFETRNLGLRSTLVALSVPAGDVASTAGVIAEYPQITHNYLRECEYNIWFTLTGPSLAVNRRVIAEIVRRTGCRRFLDLVTIRVFKIDARFSLGKKTAGPVKTGIIAKPGFRADKKILQCLSLPLSAVANTFKPMAKSLRSTEEEAVRLVSAYISAGYIRRFGAVLAHGKVGCTVNKLVAWCVPEKNAAVVSAVMCAVPQISHCYQRRSYRKWPYNIYTMVHASSEEQAGAIIDLLLGSIGTKIDSYRVLNTVRELKKSKMSIKDVLGL